MKRSPLIKSKGIVFRKIPYSESSIIADIYTQEVGLISCIISGVRKAKAQTPASLLQVMSIVDMVVYFNPKKNLHRIKEIKPAYVYQSIPMQVHKNAILLFMAEVCSKTIKESEQNLQLFSTIESYLQELDHAVGAVKLLHLKFLIALSDELGFGPMLNFSDEARHFDLMGGQFIREINEHLYQVQNAESLAQIIGYARGVRDEPELSRSQRNELLDHLIVYLRLHIDQMRELNSHQILRVLF